MAYERLARRESLNAEHDHKADFDVRKSYDIHLDDSFAFVYTSLARLYLVRGIFLW